MADERPAPRAATDGSGSYGRHLEKLSSVTVNATAESQKWAEPIIARLATEFWRLNRRVSTSGDPGEVRVQDSLARIWDIFAEHEVQAVDHDGQPYDPGLRVEVLHQRIGDGPLVILETVRPTITLSGRILQHGQVVVGPLDDPRQEATE
jgi:hypothetical protein